MGPQRESWHCRDNLLADALLNLSCSLQCDRKIFVQVMSLSGPQARPSTPGTTLPVLKGKSLPTGLILDPLNLKNLIKFSQLHFKVLAARVTGGQVQTTRAGLRICIGRSLPQVGLLAFLRVVGHPTGVVCSWLLGGIRLGHLAPRGLPCTWICNWFVN